MKAESKLIGADISIIIIIIIIIMVSKERRNGE